MNTKLALIFVIAFLLGGICHFAASKYILTDNTKIDVAKHWRLVNEYQDLVNNPNRNETHPDGLTIPFHPELSYDALVAADEIDSVDIVFPNVPKNRQTEHHWIKYVSEHNDEIIYAIGNPEYVAYKPSGQPPLHLKLWFTKSAKMAIQELINELENLAISNAE